MNADKAMEIINDIASRLGVAVEYIVPELARMEIAQDAVSAVASLLILIILVLFLKTRRSKESFNDDNDDCAGATLTFFAIVALPVAFIILTFSIHDLVGWIASPTAKAMMYVVGVMK